MWGEALLAAPSGPTYEGARRYLKPLFLARGRGRTSLTDSGAHYVPFALPLGPQGAGSVALHVADGSQIVSQRIGGPKLTLFVGGERYGSCLARLATPRLALRYLPILQTRYADARGTRYFQESFVTRRAGSLTSLVRLTVTARADTRVRFAGRSSLDYTVKRGETRTLYVAWPPLRPLDKPEYRDARAAALRYWDPKLVSGAFIQVPENRVFDAVRSLVIQNLGLTWRYSIGNPYEQFSFPESVDVAQVMAEYGFGAVARSILRTSLTRKPTPYPNWKMGEKLVGWARYYELFRDRRELERVAPVLHEYVTALRRQLNGRGLLARERYSSDIPDQVYGLHSQAVAWQGLRSIARMWDATGRRAWAREARTAAGRLERGLRGAVRASQRRLADGSLFVPVRLLDGVEPYDRLTASRFGSYWNLVMPYALASGLLPRATAEGVWRYMRVHGSRLLGLVRAGAYALYRDPVFPTSGTDQVYGINIARFLADTDKPDQLVLSLYGHLAAGMTEGTFVSGEAASVAPLAGARHRSMYLPPNGASNAAFIATLRLMLVHETRDGGLELAYATPRPWLRPRGGPILVNNVPTSFGPVSFSLLAGDDLVRGTVEVPDRPRPRSLKLRLRLPRGQRIARVWVNGRRFARFDPATGTIDLSGLRGNVELFVARTRAP